VIGDAVSRPKLLISGIPQGSILGPKLFSLYLKSVGDAFKDNGFSCHEYADHIQIYFTASFFQSSESFSSKILHCLKAVTNYMNLSRLKLNDDKTKFTIFISPGKCSLVQHIFDEKSHNVDLKLSHSVKSLGVTLDEHMTLENKYLQHSKVAAFI